MNLIVSLAAVKRCTPSARPSRASGFLETAAFNLVKT